MVTLSLRSLIKIGLVAVTGTAIAVPIALTRDNNTSIPVTTFVDLNKKTGTETSNISSDTVGTTRSSKPSTLIDSQASTNSSPKEDLSRRSQVSTRLSPVEKEKVNDKCFVIPTTSEENKQLLTCFDDKDELGISEEQPEYDNSYYLYDSVRKDIPLKIEGKIMWNSDSKQISVQVKEIAETEADNIDGTFTASGVEWDEIASTGIDLSEECTVFRNDFEGFALGTKHLLVCGNNLESISTDTPKGIPLKSWVK